MPITVVVPGAESYNDRTQEFITSEPTTITLEHSLISLSLWESKWEKPFMDDAPKNDEETLSYIRLMSLDGEIPDEVVSRLTDDNLREIYTYIDAPMTATTFSNEANQGPNRQRITSELIYYWMLSMGIDKECETWHLKRLITLIKTVSEMNKPAQKMNKADIIARNKALNAARKKQYNTTG